jgi:hypothetical protein
MPKDSNNRSTATDGVAFNKGVPSGTRELREGQKPSKPANLSRPQGVQVPPAKVTNSDKK